MKRHLTILCALSLLCAAPALRAAKNSVDDLRGLQLNHAKIPVFNRSRLQMMIFCTRAERRGEIMIGLETVLEIIRSGANADAINDGWGLKPYPLGAPLRTVFDFWRERMLYSDGVMTTEEAEIDQPNRRASGNRKVYFRSPMLDLDGVGFEADFRRRTIAVNSQVRIVIRQRSADPAELVKTPDKLPAKYEYITASGDSLPIDSERKEVMLIGNVRVDEERAFMTCDRLTVFWGGDKHGKKDRKDQGGDFGINGSGVERILADGEVVVTKKDNASEQAFADHLVCDIPKDTIRLSGDDTFPKLVSAKGEILSGKDILFERATRRGLITGGCRLLGAPEIGADGKKFVRQMLSSDTGFFDQTGNFNDFTGNVKMRDGDRTVTCDRMRVVTADRGGKPDQVAKAGDTDSLLGVDSLGGAGSKEIKSANFFGNVVLTDAAQAKLFCDRMETVFAPGASGGKLELARARCFDRVRVESRGAEGTPPGNLTSDRCELDYPGDRLTFEGHVKGRREGATLDCDKLDFYLGRKLEKSAPDTSGTSVIGAGSGKTLKKSVATGKVHVTDKSGTLDCDKLSLFFSELPAGMKATPGMFQSGGVRLTDILADGRVVAVNRASAEASDQKQGIFSGRSKGERVLRSDHARIDMRRNTSHFTGNVKVNDQENRVDCREMFVYGANSRPEPLIPGIRPPEDPDADPFALPGMTEDNVPSTINITDDVKLRRVLCLGDVLLTRTDPDTKRKQVAGGDRCEYLAEERIVTLTDTAPRRPWLRGEGRQQYASKIVFDLNTNIFSSYDTDTFTTGPAGGGGALR